MLLTIELIRLYFLCKFDQGPGMVLGYALFPVFWTKTPLMLGVQPLVCYMVNNPNKNQITNLMSRTNNKDELKMC